MNLYSIESIHLKTLKKIKKKKKKEQTYLYNYNNPKKKVPRRNLRVRSGEDALLLGSLGLLGWKRKEVTKKEEGKQNIKDKSGIKMWWN